MTICRKQACYLRTALVRLFRKPVVLENCHSYDTSKENQFDQFHLMLNGLVEQHTANRLGEVSTILCFNPRQFIDFK
jgi:hypothetical protein